MSGDGEDRVQLAVRVGARRLGVTPHEYLSRFDAGERWCTRCKAWHAIADFSRDASRPGGIASRCRNAARLAARRSDVTVADVRVVDGTELGVVQRFLEKVRITERGCWEWTAARDAKGYGHVSVGGIVERAHRVAHRMFVAPTDSFLVCHHCDNPPCVNPTHLFLGSDSDNMTDAQSKGRLRQPRLSGERHPQARLTDEEIAEVRRLRAEGVAATDVARRFGMSRSYVDQVARGSTRR